MDEKIYKVARILDNETIVISAGSDDGIKINDVFEIVGDGLKIYHPDTKEELGVLDNVKETVSVIKIYPNMCECSHISKTLSLVEISTSMKGLYSSSEYKKTLNVNTYDITLDNEQDKTIRVGDRARKIRKDIESTRN